MSVCVRNEPHHQQRVQKTKCECHLLTCFADSCKRSFVVRDGYLTLVKEVGGKFCVRTSAGGKHMWTPLQTQPAGDELVVLRQCYAYHSVKEDYCKRVTWIESHPSVAMYEYAGTAPAVLPPHGAGPGGTYPTTQI